MKAGSGEGDIQEWLFHKDKATEGGNSRFLAALGVTNLGEWMTSCKTLGLARGGPQGVLPGFL